MAESFLTLENAARNWRVSVDRLREACEDGNAEGAALLNDEWIIPSKAKRPRIKHESRESHPTEFTDGSGKTIVARTPVQAAVLNAVNKGENLGDVREYKIGGMTFIVSSIFKRQGRTVAEAAYQAVLRNLRAEGYLANFPDKEEQKIWDAFMKELRASDPVFTMTREEKMRNWEMKLEKWGFTPQEIRALMIKIEADYEEPVF